MRLSDVGLMNIGHTVQMAGMLFIGDKRLYVCSFPDDAGYLDADYNSISFQTKDDTLDVVSLDMSLEEWQVFLRQTDLLETEVLSRASDGGLAKIVLRKSQRQIEQGVSWRVFRRDGYACRYCAANDVPLTVDHVVLWEEGGPSTVENLVSACRKCNKIRGNTPYREWLSHAHYVGVSKSLSAEVIASNAALADAADSIPRRLHARSR